jgi:hypothetical protein
MNWYKRYKSEGNYLPRKVGGKKGRVSEQDVVTYVKNNPNFILLEALRKWVVKNHVLFKFH